MIHEYQFSIDSIDAANKATHTTYAEDSICNGLANQAEKINLSQNISCYLLQSKYTICIKINKTQHS